MTENQTPDWQNMTMRELIEHAQSLFTKVDSLKEEVTYAEESARKSGHIDVRDALVRAFNSALNDESLDKETASDIYDDITNRLNKQGVSGWANPFITKWSVSVSYANEVVRVIENVVADNADEAIEIVADGLTVSNVSLTANLRYNGDNGDDSMHYDDEVTSEDTEWDLIEELTITAEPAEA